MKLTFSLLFIAGIFCTLRAQISANDSAVTGRGYSEMVFYSLATGSKTMVFDTDWHLMVSIRPSQYPNSPLGGTTIRINEVRGVHVFISPTANASSFNILDTTGWQTWHQLHDSDTLIDLGAFNSNRSSNIFDFGWGLYNETTHNVIGDSVYLVQLPDGGLKKLLVTGLIFDTAWNIQYANIDNSDSQTAHIAKADYQGKEFVYLNMYNNTVLDKEPQSNTWDLEFLAYAATDGPVQPISPETGVWLNEGAQVAKAAGVDVNSNYYSGYAFQSKLNSIGWNWEIYDSILGGYSAQDSLAYFAQTAGGGIYKIVFTGFGGSSNGTISFYKSLVGESTAVDNIAAQQDGMLVFPNPASDQAVVLASLSDNDARIRIFDNTGRLIDVLPLTGNTAAIHTADYVTGIYFIALSGNQVNAVSKLIVAH